MRLLLFLICLEKAALQFAIGDTFFIDQELYEGSACKLEDDGGPGLCRKVTECPSRLDEVLEGKRGPDSPGRCGFDKNIEIVCCPTAFPEKSYPRTADIACEYYQNTVVVESDAIAFNIFRGKVVTEYEFPYMAAVGYNGNNGIEYACGGTLISAEHVLTAAHCVHGKRTPVEVKLGALDVTSSAPGIQRIPVREMIWHAQYSRQRLYYDIAVIRLSRKALLSDKVRPICLPNETERRMLKSKHVDLVVVGWGSTDLETAPSNDLMKSPSLRLADRDMCDESYTNVAGLHLGIADYMLCVVDQNKSRGADACPGDSGGPLLMEYDGNRKLIAVTSFGVGCGGTIPGIYTAVFPFIEWIEEIVWKKPVVEYLLNSRTAEPPTSTTGRIDPRIWVDSKPKVNTDEDLTLNSTRIWA